MTVSDALDGQTLRRAHLIEEGSLLLALAATLRLASLGMARAFTWVLGRRGPDRWLVPICAELCIAGLGSEDEFLKVRTHKYICLQQMLFCVVWFADLYGSVDPGSVDSDSTLARRAAGLTAAGPDDHPQVVAEIRKVAVGSRGVRRERVRRLLGRWLAVAKPRESRKTVPKLLAPP